MVDWAFALLWQYGAWMAEKHQAVRALW
jgi:hypothetical protein